MGNNNILFDIAAGQGITSAISGLGGLLFGGLAGNQQYNQQARLQQLAIEGQKEMGRFNYDQQMNLWRATNYKPQVEQMKLAGLNPALMYSKGGAGGTTGITPGNVTGGQATKPNPMDIANLQLIKSQNDLMKAQANQANAEAEAIRGYKGKLAGAQTSNIEWETKINQVEYEIRSRSKEDAINLIANTANEMLNKVNIASSQSVQEQVKANVATATEKQQVEGEIARLFGIGLDNELKRMGIKKTEQEINNMVKQIEINADTLLNSQNQTKINQQLANFETSFGGQAAQILGSFIGALKPPSKGITINK